MQGVVAWPHCVSSINQNLNVLHLECAKGIPFVSEMEHCFSWGYFMIVFTTVFTFKQT